MKMNDTGEKAIGKSLAATIELTRKLLRQLPPDKRGAALDKLLEEFLQPLKPAEQLLMRATYPLLRVQILRGLEGESE